MTDNTEPPMVMLDKSLWWNFERFCRLHGYVMTPVTGTDTVYVHKPGQVYREAACFLVDLDTAHPQHPWYDEHGEARTCRGLTGSDERPRVEPETAKEITPAQSRLIGAAIGDPLVALGHPLTCNGGNTTDPGHDHEVRMLFLRAHELICPECGRRQPIPDNVSRTVAEMPPAADPSASGPPPGSGSAHSG